MSEVWLQTYSGRVVDLLNPQEEDILIVDIAHSLANICRFFGHSVFYSVANHSILCSRIVSNHNAIYGLLHDGSECYLGDVQSNLKKYLNGKYAELEKIWMDTILRKFKLTMEIPEEVRVADKILLMTERRDLMIEQTYNWGMHEKPLDTIIAPLSPQDSFIKFLDRFYELQPSFMN